MTEITDTYSDDFDDIYEINEPVPIESELLSDTSHYTEENESDDAELDNNIDPTKYGLKKTKAKNIYCDNKELIEEIRKYQELGESTNRLGELIIAIAIHMTTMSRFYKYSHAIKEELIDHAIMQMFVSVPKFDLTNKKANAFGYLSMISYRDMLHTLTRHFKQKKVRDEIALAYLNKLADSSNDDRMAMLRTTLERNEEYNNFIKSEKTKGESQVDTFALSRQEQERRYKNSLKNKK